MDTRSRQTHPKRIAQELVEASASPRIQRHRRILLAVVCLSLVVLATYWRTLRGEFLEGDHALYSRSPLVEMPAAAGASSSHLPEWLPRATTVVSLLADRAAWGPLPSGFRTTNVALHLAATLLLFSLGLKLLRHLGLAAAAAALFAVHPIHVEAVDVVGARGEILAAIFMVLALVLLAAARESSAPRGEPAAPPFPAHDVPAESPVPSEGSAPLSHREQQLEAAGEPGSRSAWRPVLLALAIVSYLIATFASPIALTLPLIVLGADVLRRPTPRAAARRDWVEWTLLAAASLPALAVTLALAAPVPPVNHWLAGRALLESLRLLLIPFPLRYVRILGPAHGADALSILALLVAVALLGAAVVLGRWLGREGPHSLGWSQGLSSLGRIALSPRILEPLLLTVVPVAALAVLPPAGLLPEIPFPLLERRLYVPSAGLCLLLVPVILTVVELAGARGRAAERAAAACVVGIAVPFALLTVLRHPVYNNDVALFAAAATEVPQSRDLRLMLARAAAPRGLTDRAIAVVMTLLEKNPDDAEAHLLLGNYHRDRRDLESAEKAVRESLRLQPSLASAHVTLGLIERERGDVAAAEASYREAIRLDPRMAEAHSNLGALLAAHGDRAEALSELKRALELDPTLGDAAANLASFYIDQKLFDEALAVLRQGLLYSGANARLHYNLGVLLHRQGDQEGAARAYIDAIHFDPTYSRPKNNLAVLYSEQKRYPEAIALLQQVVKLEPSNERAHYNLGIAYRSSGQTKLAAAEFGAALKLNPNYTEANRALSDMFAPGNTPPPS